MNIEKISRSVIPLRAVIAELFVVVAWRMFQHKPSFGVQQPFFENDLRQFVDRAKRVRRTGEDEIELLAALFQVAEYVHPHEFQINAQRVRGSGDKVRHGVVFLHDRLVGRPAGRQLVADGAGTAENIQRF